MPSLRALLERQVSYAEQAANAGLPARTALLGKALTALAVEEALE
ncbi:hypothetical protein [Pseudarthrobacter sp. NamB4]|nr:hypothetical protein [Pseudarthrobacter sp. NamB4]